MEHRIRSMLRSKRALEAESRFLHKCVESSNAGDTTLLLARMKETDSQLAVIEDWLTLLSDDEAYVVKRHYFDGVDIMRITIEYRERWGEEYAKTDRTIKSYQSSAIRKICQFELKKQTLLENNTRHNS